MKRLLYVALAVGLLVGVLSTPVKFGGGDPPPPACNDPKCPLLP